MHSPSAAAFDELAPNYDASFATTPLGELQRRVVHVRLLEAFQPGNRVIDLGCGTGIDAAALSEHGIQVDGIDESPAMIAAARARMPAASFEVADLNHCTFHRASYEGAYANFGAINCIRDLRSFGQRLAAALKPGSRVVLTVMGPYCPWEWLWYGVRGDFDHGFRRLRRQARFRGKDVFYPTPSQLIRDLHPHFEPRDLAGLGVLLPPTYARNVVERRPNLMKMLDTVEDRIRRTRPATWLNDHYIIDLTRS